MAGIVTEEKKCICLENQYVKIVIAKEDALVESIIDKQTGRDIKAAEPVHFFSLQDQEKADIFPTKLSLREEIITVDTVLGSFAVTAKAEEGYFTLEVVSKLPEGCYKAILAHAKYDYDADDKNVTGAVDIAMTVTANPCFYPTAKDLETRVEVVRHLGDVGAKAALVIAPIKEQRELIKEVCLKIDKNKGITSVTGGAFSTEYDPNFGDYTIQVESSKEFIEEHIPYFKAIGVEQVDLHKGGGTFRQGDFKFMRYENAAEFKKNVSDILKQNGIDTGLHTYSFYLDYESDPILSNPEFQKDLNHLEEFTLAFDVEAGDEFIPTVESTEGVTKDYGFMSRTTPFILIGEEIILFKNDPQGFRVKKRGACGTKASAHKKGEQIVHIDGYYHGIAPRPGSNLFYEVARNTARAFNAGGFRMMYMDALDGISRHCDFKEEGWFYAAAFVCEILKYCEKDPMIEYSMMLPSLWAGRGRIGAEDTVYRSYKAFIKYHTEKNKAFLDSYNAATLGWYDYYPTTDNYPGNQHTKYQHLDAVDYMGTMSLLYDYSTVYNGMTPAAMERYAALRRNVERYKMYTKLRRSHYFSEETLEKVRNGRWEYHVKEKENGEYVFVEKDYQVKKLYDLSDTERNQGTFENPFSEQTPFIRIEALLSTLGTKPEVLLSLDENTDLTEQTLIREFDSEWDLSDKLAMKVRVLGNGKKGGAICIKTRCASNSDYGFGEYIIDTDFEGWREFILLECDNGERPDMPFEKEEGRYAIYRCGLNCDRMTKITVDTVGDMNGVKMSSITACEHIYEVLKNPTVKINGQALTFECELMSSDFIEFDGKKAAVIDRYGNEKPVWFKGTAKVQNGSFEAELTARSLNRCVLRAQLTLGFTGEEIK